MVFLSEKKIFKYLRDTWEGLTHLSLSLSLFLSLSLSFSLVYRSGQKTSYLQMRQEVAQRYTHNFLPRPIYCTHHHSLVFFTSVLPNIWWAIIDHLKVNIFTLIFYFVCVSYSVAKKNYLQLEPHFFRTIHTKYTTNNNSRLIFSLISLRCE